MPATLELTRIPAPHEEGSESRVLRHSLSQKKTMTSLDDDPLARVAILRRKSSYRQETTMMSVGRHDRRAGTDQDERKKSDAR